ncbi:MAG: hypothetical protein JNL38_39365, partial [Myxococcales bacterium]|nr:hypothetical protein [Myxococcales bacterium]
MTRDPRIPIAAIAVLGVAALVGYRVLSPKAPAPGAASASAASASAASRPFRVWVGNTGRETLLPPDEGPAAPPPPRGHLRREPPDGRWAWENPAPAGDGLVFATWSTSPRDAGVVGDRGLLARWDGAAWHRIHTG